LASMIAHVRLALGVSLALVLLAGTARADDPRSTLKSGKPDLKSVGPLAFGPQGILFVGDPQGAAIFAIDTATPRPSPPVRSRSRASMPRLPAHWASIPSKCSSPTWR